MMVIAMNFLDISEAPPSANLMIDEPDLVLRYKSDSMSRIICRVVNFITNCNVAWNMTRTKTTFQEAIRP